MQESQFLDSVVVVDGSTDSNFKSEIKLQEEIFLLKSNITFLTTNGGKPTALNVSLKYLRESGMLLDAVVFLDDDISFRLEDLEKGIKYLKNNDICGLSPVIVNEGETCSRFQNRNRESIFPFRKSGVLTKAGDNRWFNYRNIHKNWLDSEWLPGGAVIYDWSKIKNLSFSEQLENPDLLGYALGDDVDFSIKASAYGKLGCLHEIQVIHSSPLSSYRNPNKFALARAKWKAYLVFQYPLKFHTHRVVLMEVSRAIWHGAFKGKPKKSYLNLSIFLSEFMRQTKLLNSTDSRN